MQFSCCARVVLARRVAVAALAVAVGAVSLVGATGAQAVEANGRGEGGLNRPAIEIPEGPFKRSGGRTDGGVPGEARVPLEVPVGRSVTPPDPNGGYVDPGSGSGADGSVVLPAQPGRREERVISRADGPVDEVSELVTNADGSRTLRTYPRRVFYRGGSGKFERIDVRLAVGADGSVVSTGDSVRYRFDVSTAGVTVEARKGRPLRFRPDSAVAVVPVVSADGRSVIYPDVWPSVDVVYSVSSAGLKEDVVIKGPQGRSEFGFVVDSGEVAGTDRFEDGRRAAAGTMSVRVAGRDAGLVIAPPVATDKSGVVVPSEVSRIGLTERARDARGRQRLVLSAGSEWLGGLGVDAYPVSLDPLVGVTLPAVQWSTMRLHRPSNTTWVACTEPPSPCPRQIGNHADGNTFRSHVGYNLAALWSVIDANPDVVVSSARLAVSASQVPSPYRSWFAFDDMPSGQELNFYASNVMPMLGSTTIDTAGNGFIDFVSRFNQWRAERSAGATKWNAPTIAFRGEEGFTGYSVLGNLSLDVTFQNRAPAATAVSPSGDVDNANPTLTASGSDLDGDALSYKFWLCDWNGTEPVNCVEA